MNLNFEFKSARKFFMNLNLNFVFSKSMNLNLNFIFFKVNEFEFEFRFFKTNEFEFEFKKLKNNEWIQPLYRDKWPATPKRARYSALIAFS